MGTNVTPWKSPFCYVFTLAYRWINIDWQRYTHVAFLAVEPDFAAIMTSVLIELAFFPSPFLLSVCHFCSETFLSKRTRARMNVADSLAVANLQQESNLSLG